MSRTIQQKGMETNRRQEPIRTGHSQYHDVPHLISSLGSTLPGLDPNMTYIIAGPYQYMDPLNNSCILMATPVPQGVPVLAVPHRQGSCGLSPNKMTDSRRSNTGPVSSSYPSHIQHGHKNIYQHKKLSPAARTSCYPLHVPYHPPPCPLPTQSRPPSTYLRHPPQSNSPLQPSFLGPSLPNNFSYESGSRQSISPSFSPLHSISPGSTSPSSTMSDMSNEELNQPLFPRISQQACQSIQYVIHYGPNRQL